MKTLLKIYGTHSAIFGPVGQSILKKNGCQCEWEGFSIRWSTYCASIWLAHLITIYFVYVVLFLFLHKIDRWQLQSVKERPQQQQALYKHFFASSWSLQLLSPSPLNRLVEDMYDVCICTSEVKVYLGGSFPERSVIVSCYVNILLLLQVVIADIKHFKPSKD